MWILCSNDHRGKKKKAKSRTNSWNLPESWKSCSEQESDGNSNHIWLVGWLVGFYGISTLVGYLMLNPFWYKSILFQTIQFSISTVSVSKTVLFQTIQFSISIQFKCKYTVLLSKTFLFQAIQFSQTVLIQTILFSISIAFVHTQLNVKTVLFQVIQFCMYTQFSSIWPIDRTLSYDITPGQSGLGSDGIEGVFCISQSSSITETSPSDCLVSYIRTLVEVEGSYPFAEMRSVHSTAPADLATKSFLKPENGPHKPFRLRLG